MFALYIFCLVVGGGLLALSLFGDFFEGDADLGVDTDPGTISKIFAFRTIVYELFGFGAAGALLHTLWEGERLGLTLALAGATGIVSGLIVSVSFAYLKRSESGAMKGDASLVGLRGDVGLPIDSGDTGTVRLRRGGRRFEMRARHDDLARGEGPLEGGRAVVVVDVRAGIALVAPVDMKLLEE